MGGLKLMLAVLTIASFLPVFPAAAGANGLCDWTELVGHDTNEQPKTGDLICGQDDVSFSGETKYYVDGQGGGVLKAQVDGYADVGGGSTQRTLMVKTVDADVGEAFAIRLKRDAVSGKWGYYVNGTRLDTGGELDDLPGGLFDGKNVYIVVGLHNANGGLTSFTVKRISSGE